MESLELLLSILGCCAYQPREEPACSSGRWCCQGDTCVVELRPCKYDDSDIRLDPVMPAPGTTALRGNPIDGLYPLFLEYWFGGGT
uniref:U47-Theraphotoxin-Ct1b_1 n=1 Tax=Coremiocnemis tropix TaxID=1904443 RepID=A0A482Z7C2_CORTR